MRTLRKVRREVMRANATSSIGGGDGGDAKFCCYSDQWPRSFCSMRRSLACANATCALSPPCRRFCVRDVCDGCAGHAPGEVSRAALNACIAKRAPLDPVCGNSVQYASPCLAKAMCFVDSIASATPAPESPWRKANSASGVCS